MSAGSRTGGGGGGDGAGTGVNGGRVVHLLFDVLKRRVVVVELEAAGGGKDHESGEDRDGAEIPHAAVQPAVLPNLHVWSVEFGMEEGKQSAFK